MISNRRGARPSSSPIEHLREFAINTSKGIDITQSPINGNTVAHAKNLIVNPDGSLSLRKPLRLKADFQFGVHTLFDGGYLQETAYGDEFYAGLPVQLEWYSYRGTKHTSIYDDGNVALFKGNIKVLNLNTSSIIYDAEVLLSRFDNYDAHGNYVDSDSNIVDKRLYESNVDSVPRYIRVTKSPIEALDGQEGYIFTVMNPEPNELKFGTDGELALDPNLVLDNPYAIKDVYGAVSPMSKGVVGYALTEYGTPPKLIQDRYAPEQEMASIPVPSLHVTIPVTLSSGDKSESLVTELVLSSGYVLSIDTSITVYKTPEAYYSYYVNAISVDVKKTTGSSRGILTYGGPLKTSAMVWKATGSPTDVSEQTIDIQEHTIDIQEHTVLLDNSPSFLINMPNHNAIILGQNITSVEIYIDWDFDFMRVKYEADVYDLSQLDLRTVSSLTTSNLSERYSITTSIGKDVKFMLLKAFGYVPQSNSAYPKYYATWFETYNGVDWVGVYNSATVAGIEEARFIKDPNDEVPPALYIPFQGVSENDLLTPTGHVFENRPDILGIMPDRDRSPLQYRFRIVTLGGKVKDLADTSLFKSETLVSEVFYTVPYGEVTEFAYLDFANPVFGEKLYHKKRIYSYGHEKFFNNIFVSGIDNFETPLYNVIDVDAKQSDTVTALVPWRDYLMSATTNAMYLHTPQDNGFLTKTVTTSLGIPKKDSECCVPVLNGVIVKSNSKVYLIYPNAYAGTDSVLNISPISQPVDEYLQEFEDSSTKPFAFSTEVEYVLMLPYTDRTVCLRYNYTTRVWNMCEYPLRIEGYRINSVEDIEIYGPYFFNNEWHSRCYYKFDAEVRVDRAEPYADEMGYDNSGTVYVPIEFEWDSGQKTDNIATRKQFTESKIVFSTEDELENFPMELIVAVDGDPNITRIDVRTDAPLIKTTESVGVLGTNLRLSEDFSDPNVSKSGLIRQLIVRYSGRGRSIRHILRGTARSPFRMYEAYVRYKLIDNKR